MLSSPPSWYLHPSWAKHLPRHPILKHPQPTFFLQCNTPSFTPMQNRQNYSFVYLYILRQQTGRQKILHRMIASIPSVLISSWTDFLNSLGFSQIYEFFHPFKGPVIKIYSECVQHRDMIMYLALSAFTSSQVSLRATNKASVFFFIDYTITPNP
jgi:hypothetical protein